LEVPVQLRAQPALLLPGITLQRFVYKFRERALDAPLEEVSGLRTGKAQLGDPALEHLCPRAQLIERQLGGPRLEPRGLGEVDRGAPGQVRDRPPQRCVALERGQPAQTLHEGR
jgi:hypothetical protein